MHGQRNQNMEEGANAEERDDVMSDDDDDVVVLNEFFAARLRPLGYGPSRLPTTPHNTSFTPHPPTY